MSESVNIGYSPSILASSNPVLHHSVLAMERINAVRAVIASRSRAIRTASPVCVSVVDDLPRGDSDKSSRSDPLEV
jgi:hypothetical protein